MSLVQLNTPMHSPAQKRARVESSSTNPTTVADGVREIGQGNPVVNPPRNIPHCYNDKFTVQLDYCDAYNYVVSYDGGISQVWKMNDIYDPDQTGTGHQPFFADAWKSLYDSYAVLSCEYDVTVVNGGAEAITWTNVGTFSNRPHAMVVNLARSTTLSDITDGAVSTTLGVTTGTVYGLSERKYVQTKITGNAFMDSVVKFHGTLTPGDFAMDSINADNDAQWTAVGTSPGVPRYFGIVINSLQQAAFSGQTKQPKLLAQVFVKLRYTVQFGQINSSLRQVES